MLRLTVILMALAAVLAVPAAAMVNVVASTPELGSIAKMIGGANVSVVSLARVNQDYHKVEARSSARHATREWRKAVRDMWTLRRWSGSWTSRANA